MKPGAKDNGLKVKYINRDNQEVYADVPNVSEKIKLVLVKRKMSGQDLSPALNFSKQAIYARMQSNNWKLDQLAAISDLLDCDLEINFVMRDTQEKF